MRMLFAKCALLLAAALAAPAAVALPLAPDAMLKAVTTDVIGELRQYRDSQDGDATRIAALVESSILPLFDFERMTRIAMARNWALATPEQQNALMQEFRLLLVRTYSGALYNYRDETIVYRKLRAAPGASAVTVKSDVNQAGKEQMTLDYDMENTPAGWKIYDVRVAGVRLVSAYQDMFAERIRESGIDGLIRVLADGNRHGFSRFNSIQSEFWEKSRVLYAVIRNLLRGGRPQ